MRALAVLVALFALGGACVGADVEMLVASGTVVGGMGLADFSKPIGIDKRSLAFIGSSTALVHDDAGALQTVLRTGDPLPSPLTGTFNRLVRLDAAPNGLVAVFAEVNSTDAEAGLFLIQNGVTEPAVLDPDTSDGTVGRFGVNAAGDLAYVDPTGLGLRVRSVGTAIPVGSIGGGTLRDIVLDASDAIAWYFEGRNANVGRIGYWSSSSGMVDVAREGEPGPIGTWADFDRRRTGIALDATHGLAFTAESTTDAGAFLWTPPAGPFTQLAFRNSAVGSARIRRFRGGVRFDTDGAVVFRATLTDGRLVGVRAQDGVLTEVPPPATPAPFCEIVAPSAVLRLRGRRIDTLVSPGELSSPAGAFTSVDDYATDGRSVAFLARLEDGRAALMLQRGRKLRRIAVDGDALPFGTFSESDLRSFALGGDTVAMAYFGGHLLLKRGQHALESRDVTPDLAPGDTWTPQSVAFVGRRLFVFGFTSSIDPVTFATVQRGGIYEVSRKALRPVLVEGEPTGGRTPHVFTTIGSFAFARGQLIFAAQDASGTSGVGFLRGKRARFVPTTALLPDGTTGPVVPSAITPFGGGQVAFAANLMNGLESVPTVFDLDGATVNPVIQQGESTAVGVVDLSQGVQLAAIGRTVVFTGAVPGIRAALLARRVR